ncbi:endoplasmic reticulum protein [Moniliophthora roreri MCA 2997]|uniref:Derlin n=1 Tax=Moniliophthora roreri (strain MCA 2997) TaxID=1381753 RepID=V2WHI0_MONRO|nr:endoplasmic reticulum protein [Moniliophthora roreri MCA 2997]
MDSILAELRKIPPVTRFLAISLIGITGTSLLNLVSAYKLIYVQRFVFSNSGDCIPVSSLEVVASVSFLRMIMLYHAGSQLESLSEPYGRKSGDLAWQLFLAAVAIIPASYPVKSMVFFRPLLLCIIYLSSMLAPPGAQTSLFGLVTIPVQYMPFVMLGMDPLSGGPGFAAQSLPGAAIGHLWWCGVWKARTLEDMGRAQK